ncbi:MAG: hypothetical protein ACXVZV_10385 [Terriglobales bacterium]
MAIPLPKGEHQIDAILGFPVLSALGQLTFTSDNKFTVDSATDSSGSPIFMQQLNPLVEVNIHGRAIPLFFDTGAGSTTFPFRYYDTFTGDVDGLQKVRQGIGGAGGAKRVAAYRLPKLEIGVGGQTAVLKDISVLAEPLGTDQDLLYRTMGRDLTSQFKSFTLDFKSMRFRVAK